MGEGSAGSKGTDLGNHSLFGDRLRLSSLFTTRRIARNGSWGISYHFRFKMIKWCSTFWKQRKARLPDCIRILSVRRDAATFQKERIALGQMAFRRERRSLRLPGPRAQPSAAALLTPKKSILPFYHFKSEVVSNPREERLGERTSGRWE